MKSLAAPTNTPSHRLSIASTSKQSQHDRLERQRAPHDQPNR
jgi:hypothetical protein